VAAAGLTALSRLDSDEQFALKAEGRPEGRRL